MHKNYGAGGGAEKMEWGGGERKDEVGMHDWKR